MANHLRKDTRRQTKEAPAKKPRAPRKKKLIPVEVEEIRVIEPEIPPHVPHYKPEQSTYFKVVAWLKKLFGK